MPPLVATPEALRFECTENDPGLKVGGMKGDAYKKMMAKHL
jgi:hypothetical protein